jgi:hypothetical protein
MRNQLFWLWIGLGIAIASEAQSSVQDNGVTNAIDAMAAWRTAHPICLTRLNSQGRFNSQRYAVNFTIFNYLGNDGRANWRFLDEVKYPEQCQFCAYETGSNQAALYFPQSKQVIKYDPTIHFVFQIEDWIIRKRIDMEQLNTVLAVAKIVDGEHQNHELRLDFDPKLLHERMGAPANTVLSFSIFYSNDGEIQGFSRTWNGEIVAGTVQNTIMDNDSIVKMLPQTPDLSHPVANVNYFDARKQELLRTAAKSQPWIRALVISLLVAPPVVVWLLSRRRRLSV